MHWLKTHKLGVRTIKIFIMTLLALGLILGIPFLVGALSSPTLEGEAGFGRVILTWEIPVSDQVYDSITEIQVFRSVYENFEAGPDTQLITDQPIRGVSSYVDREVTPETTYYYRIRTVNLNGEFSPVSNQVAVTPMGKRPHGFYDSTTTLCSGCHANHQASSKQLIREDNIFKLCFLCHDKGGQSHYDVKASFSHTYSCVEEGTLACNSCHNPHDGGKDGDGKQIRLPRLLQATNNGRTGNAINAGKEFCFTCHDDMEQVYPTEGNGHDSAWFSPNPDTNIVCGACHQRHGSDIKYVLKPGADGVNYDYDAEKNRACVSCHENQPADAGRDYNFNGMSVYSSADHGQFDCVDCHNPHGTENPKYLSRTYTESVRGSAYFNESDYFTCFTANCHNLEQVTGSESKFTTGVNGTNLHSLHLNNQAKGSASCSDCHRPHGAVRGENPDLAKKVGFASVTVLSTVYDKPLYQANPEGGTCFLSCHDVKHTDDPAEDEVNGTYNYLAEPEVSEPIEEEPEGEVPAEETTEEGSEPGEATSSGSDSVTDTVYSASSSGSSSSGGSSGSSGSSQPSPGTGTETETETDLELPPYREEDPPQEEPVEQPPSEEPPVEE